MKAQGTYKVAKWEESPVHEISATSRVTRASVQYDCSGEIEGKLSVEYVMFYSNFDAKDLHNSSASYVAFIRFEGKLNGKSGSFVMRDIGAFRGGMADSELTIEPGSGTGELNGISGTGKYWADKNGARIELSVDGF